MLIQILASLLLGIFAGIFTGLIPGIHINLIGVLLVSLSISIFSNINPIYLIVFITSTAITHTFLDFIPSILLGCPDTDTELSVLPGHELLKKGLGYQAIVLTAYGSFAAIFAIILISFPATLTIDKLYNLLTKQFVMPIILILISLILILLEKKKFSALFVFLLTGILGLCVLNLDSLSQPLLPLLTGLFGGSMLMLSIKNKTKIPEQKITKSKTKLFKPLLGSLIASPLCSFLPGLGSGQAAIIGNTIARTNKKGFLVLLGATNTLVMGFSFISLYVISKTRTGAAVAIQQILPHISDKILILILATILLTGIISFFLTKSLAKFFSQNINKINYTKISIITLVILIILVILLSNFLGLLIFIASTFTGIYCISLKVKRTQMMGCLLLPTIAIYLF
jgi:putative membrane protein